MLKLSNIINTVDYAYELNVYTALRYFSAKILNFAHNWFGTKAPNHGGK